MNRQNDYVLDDDLYGADPRHALGGVLSLHNAWTREVTRFGGSLSFPLFRERIRRSLIRGRGALFKGDTRHA